MPLDFYYDRPNFQPAHRFRLQFGTRSLLILITLVALAIWWSQLTTPGVVTERQIKRLKPGMNREQVLSTLSPLKYPEHRQMYLWTYKVTDRQGDRSVLHIYFDDAGKVDSYSYWPR